MATYHRPRYVYLAILVQTSSGEWFLSEIECLKERPSDTAPHMQGQDTRKKAVDLSFLARCARRSKCWWQVRGPNAMNDVGSTAAKIAQGKRYSQSMFICGCKPQARTHAWRHSKAQGLMQVQRFHVEHEAHEQN